MSKAVYFDINEMEWKRDWDNGLVSCCMNVPDELTLQYWEFPPGAGAEEHSHPEAQLTYVQSGIIKYRIDGEERIFREGCFAYIPPYAKHASENIGSQTAINIDVFVPMRNDRDASEKIKSFELNEV